MVFQVGQVVLFDIGETQNAVNVSDPALARPPNWIPIWPRRGDDSRRPIWHPYSGFCPQGTFLERRMQRDIIRRQPTYTPPPTTPPSTPVSDATEAVSEAPSSPPPAPPIPDDWTNLDFITHGPPSPPSLSPPRARARARC